MSGLKKSHAKFHGDLFVRKDVMQGQSGTNLLAMSEDVLIARTKNADSILIVSPYYDVDFLKGVFGQKATIAGKSIEMIFARPSPAALPKQLAELKELRSTILEKGNSKTKVRICFAGEGRFLHSKLYTFKRGKWLRTLVGSANATENGFCKSDEILIELHGPSPSIQEYARRTASNAEDCETVVCSRNERYPDIESLLRDGFLYFKAARSLPQTIDCFQKNERLRQALSEALEGTSLPGHEGQSLGFFNVLKFFKVESPVSDPKREAAPKTNISRVAIETSFGYWVPAAYREKVESKLTKSVEKKTKSLLAWGKELGRISDHGVRKSVRETYFKSIDAKLSDPRILAVPLTIKQKEEIEGRIFRGTKLLQEVLTNKEKCQRLARLLHGAPVPEIWEDPQSKNELVQSFAETLSWKLRASERLPGIVNKLKSQFDLKPSDDAGTILEKIKKCLKDEPITRDFWDGDAFGQTGEKFWVGYWRDPDGPGNAWDADECFDDLGVLLQRVKVVVAGNRYKYAAVYEGDELIREIYAPAGRRRL